MWSRMNVTVTDASRRYVTDLDQQDFHIFEDGRPQQVTFFQKSGLPLALALLMDTSASMERNLAVAQRRRRIRAGSWVRRMSRRSSISIRRVQVRQEFTSDRAALEKRDPSDGGRRVDGALQRGVHRLEGAEQDDPR